MEVKACKVVKVCKHAPLSHTFLFFMFIITCYEECIRTRTPNKQFQPKMRFVLHQHSQAHTDTAYQDFLTAYAIIKEPMLLQILGTDFAQMIARAKALILQLLARDHRRRVNALRRAHAGGKKNVRE